MKIRNGFVSNSSSSSFVLEVNERFRTVKDVANYIIYVCQHSWDYDKDVLNVELKALNNVKDPDTPVHFNTGGDKTYIRKIDDKILITTTQNADFPDFNKHELNDDDISEDFYKQFEHCDEYGDFIKFDCIEDLTYYFEVFNDFLILKHNFKGKHIYFKNCKKCGDTFSSGWKLEDGKEICGCQTTKAIRKEKLTKIKK